LSVRRGFLVFKQLAKRIKAKLQDHSGDNTSSHHRAGSKWQSTPPFFPDLSLASTLAVWTLIRVADKERLHVFHQASKQRVRVVLDVGWGKNQLHFRSVTEQM
jgi:hypothetical protein